MAEAGEESIFAVEKQRKPCQVHPANCVKPRPELKNSRKQIFPTACRIPVWPFDVLVKAGQRTAPEGLFTGEDMPQYLVAIHHPDNYDCARSTKKSPANLNGNSSTRTGNDAGLNQARVR